MEHEYDPEDYTVTVVKRGDGSFSVSLPHQCDEWEILGGHFGTDRQFNQVEVVRQVLAFCTVLQRAVEAISTLPSGPITERCVECGNPDQERLQLWPCHHVVCTRCDFKHGKVLSRDHRGALESITILNEHCTHRVRMSPEERPT